MFGGFLAQKKKYRVLYAVNTGCIQWRHRQRQDGLW